MSRLHRSRTTDSLLFVSVSGLGLLFLSYSHSQGMRFPDFRDRSPRELTQRSLGRRIELEEYGDESLVGLA